MADQESENVDSAAAGQLTEIALDDKENTADPDPGVIDEIQAKHEIPPFWNPDVRARVYRYCELLLPVLYLAILHLLTGADRGDDRGVYLCRILGVAMAVTYTLFFLNLFCMLYPGVVHDDNYLFRVETKLSHVPGWTRMRIAQHQIEYPDEPLRSISEFSAISGGQAWHMLNNIGPIVWVTITMLWASEIDCNGGDQTTLGWADGLMLIGVSGVVMVGIFECNEFDRGMKFFHNFGLGMIGFMFIGSLVEAHESGGGTYFIIPIVLNVIGWPTFIYLQCIMKRGLLGRYRGQHLTAEKKQEITRLSVKCLALETIANYCCSLCMAYYLFIWNV